MKKLIYLLMSMFLVYACANNSEEVSEEAVEVEEAGDGIHFGETIDESGAITLAELLASMPAEVDSLNAKVKVYVSSVCQKKGCWMDVTAGEESAQVVKVTFKDYGFFVPLDFDGKEAIVEGTAYRQVTSVEELRHMAEDALASEDEILAITEPKEEIRFVASGVLKL
jgi:hypothetical protein